MESKVKILVAGDVRGRFKQLFTRVESINKKSGPFDILLCVGEFFDEQNNDELIAYRNGNKLIAVPTYILGPNCPENIKHYESIADSEICSNLTYLGKRGLYTLSSGVKIVYLSGIELPAETESKETMKSLHYFTKEDIAAIRNSCFASKSSASDYKGIDILLTSQWPLGISEENKNASKYISFLSKEIKPRYHFCGLNGKFLELPPFRMAADQITQLQLCTRFIALADVGNSSKEKYIYALSLSPADKTRVMDLIQKTTNEIDCPYAGIDFSICQSGGQSFENKQYFFDMRSGQDSHGKRRSGDNRQNKRTKIMHIDQEKCWFCLSSPDVEKHLVISIGEHFYLALAKGPINDYHVLIMSITHIPAAALLTDEDWNELMKFKEAIRKFFKDEGLVVCFTERHYKSSHLQINALGIDEGFSWKIPHSFEDKAEEFNLEFETLPALTSSQMLPQQGPYFVAELPNETTLLTRQMRNFPLHFARDVFCSENLLNCDDKVNWKECNLDKAAEVELVQIFRKKFSKFDFTL